MGEAVEESYEDIQSYAQAIKGDKGFAERVMREAGKVRVVRRLTEAQVASAVAAAMGLRLSDLMGGGRQRRLSRARHIAAYLGRVAGGIPVARMADYFGREESTFTRGVLRLEEKMTKDLALRKTFARLDASLQVPKVQEAHG